MASGAYSPNHANGLVVQEGVGFGLADHGKAARFVEIGGHLGEELVMAQAD